MVEIFTTTILIVTPCWLIKIPRRYLYESYLAHTIYFISIYILSIFYKQRLYLSLSHHKGLVFLILIQMIRELHMFKKTRTHNFRTGCLIWWCGSTYMAVRLSDVSSKTGKKHKKCIFCLFLSLRRTASQPYRLSHINVLHINLS